MSQKTERAGLRIEPVLCDLLEQKILPGTSVTAEQFWQTLADILAEFAPRNRALLAERERLQALIDEWHRERAGQALDPAAYRAYLEEIGYLQPEVEDFTIDNGRVDDEIAHLAGPQLVVPVMNARYALNAANARWGSLYDALYGSDVIPQSGGAEIGESYNPVRGEKVIAWGRRFLDRHFPLSTGEHDDAQSYAVVNGELQVVLADGRISSLRQSTQFRGYLGEPNAPTSVLLQHNGLHVELQIDPTHPIGAADRADVKDIVLEAAITTIQDCEDSVAAVDAQDKALVYRNWLGLMQGNLEETFTKGDSEVRRVLEPDREFLAPNGSRYTIPGRSLMFVRNVGHLMTSDAILDAQGEEIPEGIMDALFTSTIALHDIRGTSDLRNSRSGNVYIVKPKMHGPEEVRFTCDLFQHIEEALGLEPFTLKLGIMDEERRTSVNLKACIAVARERVVFINTGFLDRTGDEIHTSMEAGPMVPKGAMKDATWIKAYEERNVDIGLSCGFSGRAQIGKGMWPMPARMAAMLEAKVGHPRAGASTAWVPSPTAAVLHALHYHEIDVAAQQAELAQRPEASLDDLLCLPLLQDTALPDDEIQRELDNNAQGILGYVVRWVEQGVGCSTVPDINDIGLMEDRATLRISSQHIANWLRHGICSREQVEETLKRMAKVVDEQNAGDPDYRAMAPDFDASIAFPAARDLVFKGTRQPAGYTEPILHARRREAKAGGR